MRLTRTQVLNTKQRCAADATGITTREADVVRDLPEGVTERLDEPSEVRGSSAFMGRSRVRPDRRPRPAARAVAWSQPRQASSVPWYFVARVVEAGSPSDGSLAG
jgi:hypothetical protein